MWERGGHKCSYSVVPGADRCVEGVEVGAKKSRRLSPKQSAFVQEYLVDLNATQAAIRAGYSSKTAGEQAVRLLGNVKVSEALQKALEARQKRTQVTADRVLLELARLGLSDVRKLFDENGNLKKIQELDDDAAACVSSVKVVEKAGGDGDQLLWVKEVKLWDKNSALEKIGKHLKMFTEKVDLNVAMTHEEALRELEDDSE